MLNGIENKYIYVCTVNPLSSPPVGISFSTHFWGGGGGRGGAEGASWHYRTRVDSSATYSFSYIYCIKSRLILYIPSQQADIGQLRVQMAFEILDQKINLAKCMKSRNKWNWRMLLFWDGLVWKDVFSLQPFQSMEIHRFSAVVCGRRYRWDK